MAIPLQPSRSPVNQLFNPEVRASGKGAKLLQVADALSHSGQSLAQINERRHAAFVERSRSQASKLQAERRFKNQQGWKDAVKRGEIKQSDNPWFMVQLRQEVARHEAQSTHEQLKLAYETSPVRFKNDPTAVEAWFDEQTARLLEGRDAYEMEVLAPMLEQSRGSLVAQHMQFRSRERQEERNLAFAKNVEFDLQSDGDIETKISRLNDLATEAGKTMHFSEINDIIRQQAFNHALANRDPDLAEQVLAGVKTPGGSLGDTNATKIAMDNLRQQIANEEYQDQLRAERVEKARFEQMVNSAAKTYIEYGKANGLDPYAAVMYDAEFYEKNPELADEVAKRLEVRHGRLAQLREKQEKDLSEAEKAERDTLLREGMKDAVRGVEPLTLYDRLLGIVGGAAEVDQLASRVSFARSQQRQDAMVPLDIQWQMGVEYRNGTMTDEKFFAYADKVDDQRLKARLLQEHLDRSTITKTRPGTAEIDKSNLLSIEERIRLSPAGQNADEEQLVSAIRLAGVEYESAALQARMQGLPPEQERKLLTEAVESIVSRNKGLSVDEWKKGATLAEPPPAPEAQQEEEDASAEFPQVAQARQLEPSLQSVLKSHHFSTLQELQSIRAKRGDNLPPEAYAPQTKGFWSSVGENISHGFMSDLPAETKTSADALSQLRDARVGAHSTTNNHAHPKFDAAFREEDILWTRAQDRRQALLQENLGQQLASHLDAVAARKAKNIPATYEDKRKANELTAKITELRYLTKEVGITADEVVEGSYGPDAWQHYPMFASRSQLNRIGPHTAKAIQLPPEKYAEFRAAQIRAIERARLAPRVEPR